MIEVKAVASAYTGSIYVVFNENKIVDKYELYRNGELIAATGETDYGPFERPTLFDHDHHTNLFRKDSNHQLMYEDIDVAKFKEYSYYVKYYYNNGEWNSNTVYITLQ